MTIKVIYKINTCIIEISYDFQGERFIISRCEIEQVFAIIIYFTQFCQKEEIIDKKYDVKYLKKN